MIKYIDSVFNKFASRANGIAAVGATITVRFSHNGAKASLYEDDKVTARSNPVTADDNGKFYFTVAGGVYNLIFN